MSKQTMSLFLSLWLFFSFYFFFGWRGGKKRREKKKGSRNKEIYQPPNPPGPGAVPKGEHDRRRPVGVWFGELWLIGCME